MPRPSAEQTPLALLIDQAIAARQPLLWLQTPDEARVVDLLAALAGRYGIPLTSWSSTDAPDVALPGSEPDPCAAICAAAERAEPGLLLLKDPQPYLPLPRVQRALKDAYYRLREIDHAAIVLLAGELAVPESLRHQLRIIEVPPPSRNELDALVATVLAEHGNPLPDGAAGETLVQALRGLSLDQARHVLHAVARREVLSGAAALDAVHAAKRSLTGPAAVLEYVPADRAIDDVGGLSNLKRWIGNRAGAFVQRAVDAGEPVPRGVLMMGVSGCGKSLFAKIVARVWNVPLFRLDMNLVFSGGYGNPEAAFHRALRTAETIAPMVLWIDEIENGLGFAGDGGGNPSHLFAAFLTWMQEKPPLVFVAATANRIEFLPPEMIRKGRFDQVFFVDLPDARERAELFAIHLRRQLADPASFQMAGLVRESAGWSGAEIEQAVVAARTIGLHHRRPFTQDDLLDHLRHNVPLSRTMSEQIKALRDWAWDRAAPASAGRGTDSLSMVDLEDA